MFEPAATAPVLAPPTALLIPGSRTATVDRMPTIPQKEIRNNVGEILRRAEAGEEFTITVSGRPVAHLGPLPADEPEAEASSWIDSAELSDLFALPVDPTFMQDIEEGFRANGWLRDPEELEES